MRMSVHILTSMPTMRPSLAQLKCDMSTCMFKSMSMRMQLRSPRIVQVYGAVYEEKMMMLVMDLVASVWINGTHVITNVVL